MPTVALRFVISGRVQGVGFRAWMRREARKRSLRGWVRNRRDGSVEALVIGEESSVGGLSHAVHVGPPMAVVDSVATHQAVDDGCPDFSEYPTV